MLIIKNLTRELACMQLEKFRAEGKLACDCDACMADILTYTLNRLAPIYVNGMLGEALCKNKVGDPQFMVDLVTTLSKAVNVVGQRPNHDPAKVDERLGMVVNECLLTYDLADLRIASATSQAAYLLGYQNGSLKGMPITDLIIEDSREPMKRYLQECKADTHGCYVQRKDGKQFLVSFHLSPIVEDERLIGGLIYVRDVYDRLPPRRKHTTSLS